MKNFLLRITIVFLVVFLQINFLNLIFSDKCLANLAVLAIISWIIVSGFQKMWSWIVALGLLTDIFLAERLGINVLFFILFAYLISFISKSFMIERRFFGFLLVIVFILLGNFLGSLFDFIWSGGGNFNNLFKYIVQYFSDGKSFVCMSFISGISFYFIYSLINYVEKYIARNENRLKLNF